MKTIRKGVWETNSSSCHSITIGEAENALMLELPRERDGSVILFPGEFGWEQAYYERDPSTMASYALTFAMQNHEGIKGATEPICVNEIPDLSDQARMLIRLVCQQMDIPPSKLFFQQSSGYWEWGYVDHQSCHLKSDIFESEESLRRFIFHPESTLTTDNDNH